MSSIQKLSNHQKFDVWLFAIDLVNYVFFKSSRLPSDLIIGHFPGFFCECFSETLKRAVHFIKDSVKPDVDEIFAQFQQRNEFTPQSYKKYAKEFRKANFPEGFEPENFLYYSVHLAYLAFRFLDKGVHQAEISAAICVAQDLHGGSANYSLWEAFDEIAEKILYGSTKGGNVSAYPRVTATDSINCFETPNFYRKAKGIVSRAKSNSGSRGGSIVDPSPKVEDLSKSKQYNREILPRSCKRVMAPIEECRTTDRKLPIPSEESLESSLEELSISSTLPIKLSKVEGTSNSTPADFGIEWKHGILKRRTSGSPFAKHMIKLSPINRIKAQSVGFK